MCISTFQLTPPIPCVESVNRIDEQQSEWVTGTDSIKSYSNWLCFYLLRLSLVFHVLHATSRRRTLDECVNCANACANLAIGLSVQNNNILYWLPCQKEKDFIFPYWKMLEIERWLSENYVNCCCLNPLQEGEKHFITIMFRNPIIVVVAFNGV